MGFKTAADPADFSPPLLRIQDQPSAPLANGAPGFGSDAQTLRPFSGLQDGFVKLS